MIPTYGADLIWNSPDIEKVAFSVNVTDTASSATSKLWSWSVDGAPVLEVTKAGSITVYNDWTDATDFERGFIRFTSNAFTIGTEEGASGGTPRNVVLDGANRAAAIANVTGGATVDAESRTAINGILAALRSHGIVASA